MSRQSDRIDEVKGLLLKKRVLSLQWMAEHLGISDRTTQRYMKDLQTLTSFTHKRRFFTLADIPHFDGHGIWFYRQIGFSTCGNGLDTIVSLINQSQDGFSREELESILKTGLSKQIQILVQREKIHRIKLGNKYLYVPESVVQNKKARLKLVGNRQTEEHFEKDVKKTDLIALLKGCGLSMMCDLCCTADSYFPIKHGISTNECENYLTKWQRSYITGKGIAEGIDVRI